MKVTPEMNATEKGDKEPGQPKAVQNRKRKTKVGRKEKTEWKTITATQGMRGRRKSSYRKWKVRVKEN